MTTTSGIDYGLSGCVKAVIPTPHVVRAGVQIPTVPLERVWLGVATSPHRLRADDGAQGENMMSFVVSVRPIKTLTEAILPAENWRRL